MDISKLILSKYPVTTDNGEYKVNIEESFIFDGYDVEIYKHDPTKRFRKDKLLHGYLCLYRDYLGDFSKMAKDSVHKYEEKERKDIEKQNKIENGIKEFELWDGKIN